ncbi:3-deoxy-7-phosphoheptulonate synthase [Iodobacter ciconiae]|uniref:3-deoxy-7-phosphoheptulonate synthase n=1 Tax=Iodobacter ciconiae TaxID=2496266 RepID=A0A3S8ZRP1_9NEIS|nr:3-deoxy-7-phosphoheptulonate synthase [Iodobacter ciconiae]AZN36152.1 3-deoxy-7-phosphoheptulonate synthase [Iodobacter ciconiae]
MIIVMKYGASEAQIDAVVRKIHQSGLKEHLSRGAELTIIGVIGDEERLDPSRFAILPGVDRVNRVAKQYKIVSRSTHPDGTTIKVRGIEIGGEQVQIIAGPYAAESAQQMDLSADLLAAASCRLMRCGAFYSEPAPQKGREALAWLKDAAARHQLPVVAELPDVRMLDAFMEYDIEMIQIGERNMQNLDLLREIGRINKPIILKRGVSATIVEWLMAAESIAAGGNHNIIFCEHGIRTFENAYRNVLDISAIAVLKQETHLPVMVDPSDACGKAWMVPALAQAAIAAGADGVLLDVHPCPAEARYAADQALSLAALMQLMAGLKPLVMALGRSL